MGLMPNVKCMMEKSEGGVRGGCYFWLDDGMADSGWKMLSI